MKRVSQTYTPRRALLLMGILLAATTAMGGTPSGKKVIKQVQNAFKDLESFTCRFHQETQISMIGETEIVEGHLYLAKKDRFRYQTPTQVMVTDGETLWRYSPLTDQVLVENLEDAGPNVLPRQILFEYPKWFEPEDVKAAFVANRPAYLLELAPKEEGLGVATAKVWVDQEDWIARRFEMTDESGNRTTYVLNEIELNTAIPDTTFTLTAPEGVRVFDLR